jgi:hypothetical protein
MLNKTKLIYDPNKDGDVVASYLKAADGTLISKTEAAGKTALDVNVANSASLFSKPFDSLIVLSKSEYGDPVVIKSTLQGVDVQQVTLVYDEEGDFQSLQVSDF